MQTEYVLRDSYANAYYLNEDKFSSHILDVTHMKPGIHERKWAPDSLAFVVRLAYNYWQKTGDASFADTQWDNASRSIYHTFLKQQRLENEGDYTFQRLTFRKTEIVPRFGLGAQTKKIGLIHATHRPSDDACELPFHIPSNLFVAQSLRQLSEMYLIIPERRDEIFAKRCQKLSNTIINAVFEHGIIDHPKFGRIFAFEIDGRGHSVIHDDASPPQLVSLPMYSDIDPDSEVYQNTRNLALSFNNPNYFKGNAAEGLGSSHTGRDRICTISPMIRAITSDNDEEIRHCLEILKNIHNKQFQYGESVLVNGTNVGSRDSRKWFPWPDSTFAYLILKLQSERPYLL